MIYNEGISQEGEIIALGEKFGVVEKIKATYFYNGDVKMGVGYDKTRVWLKENKKERTEILKKIRQGMRDEK